MPLTARGKDGSLFLWLVCARPEKKRHRYHYHLGHAQSPVAQFLNSGPKVQFEVDQLMALLVLQPCALTPLTPLDEVARWQMRCIVAALSHPESSNSSHAQRGSATSLPPQEVWAHRHMMQGFEVRRVFALTRKIRALPLSTSHMGLSHMVFQLRPGVIQGHDHPLLAQVTHGGVGDQASSVSAILSIWDVEGRLDGHRVACLLAQGAVGELAVRGMLRHLILPFDLTHDVQLLPEPNPFPRRRRASRQQERGETEELPALSSESLLRQLSDFRMWACELLAYLQSDGSFGAGHLLQRRVDMERFAQWMESMLHNLRNRFDLTVAARGRYGIKFTAAGVVKCLFSSPS